MKFVTGIIFGVLMVIFIFQNIDLVDINFLFWHITISRALMIFVVFLIGVILGILLKSLKRGKEITVEKSEQPEL